MNLIKKEYNQKIVTFDLTSDMMINLTDMAKANGKLVGNWTQLQSTKDYLSEYSSSIGIPIDEIIIVKQGGNGGGTWANQDIALYFAQWLSPKFHVWCNKQIKELLTNGNVKLKVPQTYAEALLEAGRLALELESQTKRIEKLVHSNHSYTTSMIAKEAGFKSAQELNQLLLGQGIIYQQRGVYLLVSKYSGKGYQEIKQKELDNGKIIYNATWTNLGREWLLNFCENI